MSHMPDTYSMPSMKSEFGEFQFEVAHDDDKHTMTLYSKPDIPKLYDACDSLIEKINDNNDTWLLKTLRAMNRPTLVKLRSKIDQVIFESLPRTAKHV